MSEKDRELEKLLAPFKKTNPDSSQIERWTHAVQSSRRKKIFPFFTLAPIYQLLTSLIIGIVIGGAVLGNRSPIQTAFCSSPKVCKCSV